MQASPLTVPFLERHIMEDHDSYHGPITGEEAATRLSMERTDCYLTRFSNKLNSYVLSVKKRDPKIPLGNFRLIIDQMYGRNTYIDGMERRFNNTDELLTYYEQHPIHPLYNRIGRRFTKEDFNHTQEQRKHCVLQ